MQRIHLENAWCSFRDLRVALSLQHHMLWLTNFSIPKESFRDLALKKKIPGDSNSNTKWSGEFPGSAVLSSLSVHLWKGLDSSFCSLINTSILLCSTTVFIAEIKQAPCFLWKVCKCNFLFLSFSKVGGWGWREDCLYFSKHILFCKRKAS